MIPTKTSVIQHKWTAALTLKKSLGPGWIRVISRLTLQNPGKNITVFFFNFNILENVFLLEEHDSMKSLEIRRNNCDLFFCANYSFVRAFSLSVFIEWAVHCRLSQMTDILSRRWTVALGAKGFAFFSFLSRSGESAKTWYADSRDASPLTDGGRQR